MDEGSKLRARAGVCARGAGAVAARSKSIDPAIVHIHFASRGSTLRKMILAEHGGACAAAAGAARARRGFRPVPSQSAGAVAPQREPHAAAGQRVDRAVDPVARLLRRGVRGVAVAGGGAAEPGARARRVADRAGRTQVQFLSPRASAVHARVRYDLVNAFAALPRRCAPARAWCWPATAMSKACESWPRRFGERVRVLSWIDAPSVTACSTQAMCSCCRRTPRVCRWRCSRPWPRVCLHRTPVGGIPDVFTHGAEGLLVRPAMRLSSRGDGACSSPTSRRGSRPAGAPMNAHAPSTCTPMRGGWRKSISA